MLVVFEAERGQIVAPFEVVSDTTASRGAFVRDGNSIGVGGGGSATYSFSLADAHSGIAVWVRAQTLDTAADSFFIAIDGATSLEYDTSACIFGSDWHWVELTGLVFCPTIPPPLFLDLAAGPHTIVLTSREGQSVVDLLLLTDDPTFIPPS